MLQKHVGDVHTSLHSAAAERVETFTSVANGQQSDILSVASSAHRQKMEENMRMLTSVLISALSFVVDRAWHCENLDLRIEQTLVMFVQLQIFKLILI